jgi:hypothetical protein
MCLFDMAFPGKNHLIYVYLITLQAAAQLPVMFNYCLNLKNKVSELSIEMWEMTAFV